MEKQHFLERFRDRLTIPVEPARVHTIPADPAAPEPVYTRPLDDLPAAFLEEAAEHGARPRRVWGDAALESLVAEVVAAHRVRSAVLSGDAEVERIRPLLSEFGVGVLPWRSPADAAEADLGITGAALGIAATGSIVVDAARAGGRTVSLLPPVHLALVPAAALVATPAGLWRRMGEHCPDGLPSQLVLITGPSKTGDIEQSLITGVHGPKHLWIGLLED